MAQRDAIHKPQGVIPFSSRRQLPVRQALHACGFTLYLRWYCTTAGRKCKEKKQKGGGNRLFQSVEKGQHLLAFFAYMWYNGDG